MLTALDDSLGACLWCLKVCAAAFPYKQAHDVQQSITTEEGIGDKIQRASQHIASELEVTWNQNQSVHEFHTNLSDESVEFEAWDRKGFIDRFGTDPDKLGLVPLERPHPLTKQMVSVYYTPKPGPLFTLRVGLRESAQWAQECMAKQVYDEQGRDTAKFIADNFDVQKNLSSIMWDNNKFSSLLAQAASLQRPMGAMGSTWPGAVVAHAASPKSFGATSLLGTPPKMQVELNPTTPNAKRPLSPSSSASSIVNVLRPTVPTAGMPAPSRVVVSTLAHQANALTSRSAIEQPAGSVRGASPRTQPPPKAARTSVARTSSSHLTINCNTTSVPLSMPGVVSKLPVGSDEEDNMSVNSVSMANLSKDKYERAVQRAPLTSAFNGVNMTNAISNLKKMISVAKNEVKVEDKQNCQLHLDKLTACQGMFWPSMMQSSWEATKKNALEVKENTVPIPPMTWMYYAGRRAIEMVEPRARKTDVEAFGKSLNLRLEYRPEKQSFEHPCICSDNVPESVYTECSSAVVRTVIVEGMYIHTLGRGAQYQYALVGQLRMVTQWVEKLPETRQKELEDLVRKTKCLSCVFGELPFENNSTVSDVSKVMDNKSDIITITLTDKDFWGKGIVEGIWSRTASEAAAWLIMKPCLENVQNKTDDSEHSNIAKALEKFGIWKIAVRPSTVKVLEKAISAYIVHVMDGQDFSTTSDSSHASKERSIQCAGKRLRFSIVQL